jgi:predicted nucleic acid-binding protein
VRFWDSSSIVPLLISQPASQTMAAAFATDPDIVAWWGTEVECTSAIERLQREGRLRPSDAAAAYQRLDAHLASWQEIQPASRLRKTAERLLRVHPLRSGDAFQLAAAVIAADGSPETLSFVTLDERLARAAEREGFPVIEPA